jgi:iduronate 2-sulfatase
VKKFLSTLLWLVSALMLTAGETKHNVLFLAIDDLRPELGCYGVNAIKTPNIDRLAQRSVVFERAYCQQAICSPSRMSLLSGLRPDTTRIYDLTTPLRKNLPDVTTLPQHFKNHGYHTISLGKIFHGTLYDEPSWSEMVKPPLPYHDYALPENQALLARRQKEYGSTKPYICGPTTECADVSDSAYHDGLVADQAIEKLRAAAQKNQPFWLGVGLIRPHLPFNAPKKYWDLYDRSQLSLPTHKTMGKNTPTFSMWKTENGEMSNYSDMPPSPFPDDFTRQLKHGYYAATSYMDAQVGRVLDELDRLGLREKTIIVLWGDHGYKLGEHGGWCKHTNVDLDTRVPLLISAPALTTWGTSGKKSASLVELVDLYPTLADLCGLPISTSLEGTSLVPILKNPAHRVKNATFSQYPGQLKIGPIMGYSMTTERYRFTRWVEQKNHQNIIVTELYDHQSDPQESVNIAGGDPHAERVRELSTQLQGGWRAALIKVK